METKKKFTPTKDMVEVADSVFKAMAYVGTLKPIVTGYQEAVLKKHQFVARDIGQECREGDIILNPEHSYLLEDADFEIYLEEIEEARAEAGLKVNREGNCPLLEAESLLRDAQRLLVDTMQPITKISTDDALCSKNGLENYRQLTDLILKLLAPFVKGGMKI